MHYCLQHPLSTRECLLLATRLAIRTGQHSHMSKFLTQSVRPTPQQVSTQARRLTTTGSMHILGISGSLRKGSYNTMLLKAAQKVRQIERCRRRVEKVVLHPAGMPDLFATWGCLSQL